MDEPAAVSEKPAEPTSPPTPPRRGGGWFSWGLVTLLVVAAVAWFLPMILARTVAHSNVLEFTGTNLPANVTFGSAELSWTAPVLLHDVEVAQESGGAKASAKSVTSQLSLWELIRNPTAPWVFTLDGFSAEVRVPQPDPTRSRIDVDQVLQKILNTHCPQFGRSIELQIVSGELRFVTSDGTVLAVVGDLAGKYSFGMAESETPGHLAVLQGAVTQPATEGKLQLDGEWLPAMTDLAGAHSERLRLKLDLQHFPLAVVAPLLQSATPADTDAVDGTSLVQLTRTADESLGAKWSGTFAPSPHAVTTEPSPVRQLFPIDWEFLASYSSPENAIAVPQLQFNSTPLKITGRGTISQVREAPVADLSGSIQGDAEAILARLPESVRRNVSFQGLRWSGFQIRGPLGSMTQLAGADTAGTAAVEHLQVSAVVAWDQAQAYGLLAPQGALAASLEQGWLQLTPQQMLINAGQVRQLPRIQLAGPPYRFAGEPGMVLERIQLTEPLLQQWVQYVAPLLANSTSLAGEMSLELAGPASGEFGSPEKMDVPGFITVHSATLGPGPLIRQITGAVEQVALITGNRLGVNERLQVTLENQKFPFRVLEGRVHHKDFGMMVGNVRVSSTGSVGLDESVDLTISIALPDAWLKKPVLRTLQGESIALAVRGTLDQPQLDLRPLGEFGQRIGVKAAGGLLDRILNGPR